MANKINASHILVEKQSQAMKILEDLKKGADFKELA
jgi:parvulin-like peptidyl-prolyl isomerase